jgi:hypothetical protein
MMYERTPEGTNPVKASRQVETMTGYGRGVKAWQQRQDGMGSRKAERSSGGENSAGSKIPRVLPV